MTVCSLFPLIPFLLPCLPSYVGRSPRTPWRGRWTRFNDISYGFLQRRSKPPVGFQLDGEHRGCRLRLGGGQNLPLLQGAICEITKTRTHSYLVRGVSDNKQWFHPPGSVFGGGGWWPFKPVPLVRVEVLQALHHLCTAYPWLCRGALQKCPFTRVMELDLHRQRKGVVGVFAWGAIYLGFVDYASLHFLDPHVWHPLQGTVWGIAAVRPTPPSRRLGGSTKVA